MRPSDPDPALALPEYAPMAGVARSDGERWPGRSPEGAARLDAVLHRPDAPCWTHRAGDLIDRAARARVLRPVPLEGWLDAHLAVARRLPAYRGLGRLERLEDFPTVSREDLARDVSRFVPRDADLERVVTGTSSGSTGAALVLPDDPEELARGLLLLRDQVAAAGADWRPEPGRAALAHVLEQREAYTYASTVSVLDESVMVRLNLAPAEWRDPADRASFLAALDPQVVTGPPAALEALLGDDLVGRLRPLAVVSSASALAPALRRALADAFRCPVLDLYGLHETRPVAARTDDGPFVVLRRRVLVEVLGDDDRPVPEGDRGEIVVTAAENPFLPLVRYRTGDTGRLVEVDGRAAIADLEGRATVRFVTPSGAAVPSVDLTQQLQACGARGWVVRQDAHGEVRATLAGGDAERAAAALAALLGRPAVVTVVPRIADLGPGKPRRFVVDGTPGP